MPEPFAIKDCALLAIATGLKAQNLREMKHYLEEVHPGCIYYHFWGGLLHPRFEDSEFHNDFASWAARSLNDLTLAERLAIIDPTDFPDIEELRRETIEVIEERLDETEIVPWVKPDQQFHFIRSKIVVLNTHIKAETPEELGRFIPSLPPSSVFYHFIDARRRTLRGRDDISEWVAQFGPDYAPLARTILDIDPYSIRLTLLRQRLTNAFKLRLPGRES